jgi:hypothetical protein
VSDEIESSEISSNHLSGASRQINEEGRRSATAERLNAGGATPSAEVKDVSTWESRFKHGEERLPNTIGEGARPRLWYLNQTAT